MCFIDASQQRPGPIPRALTILREKIRRALEPDFGNCRILASAAPRRCDRVRGCRRFLCHRGQARNLRMLHREVDRIPTLPI